jgi:hypothetical protein
MSFTKFLQALKSTTTINKPCGMWSSTKVEATARSVQPINVCSRLWHRASRRYGLSLLYAAVSKVRYSPHKSTRPSIAIELSRAPFAKTRHSFALPCPDSTWSDYGDSAHHTHLILAPLPRRRKFVNRKVATTQTLPSRRPSPAFPSHISLAPGR